MATLVSLQDAIYSLGYWIGVAHCAAAGTVNTTDMDHYGVAYGTNLVANITQSTVTGAYTTLKASDVT